MVKGMKYLSEVKAIGLQSLNEIMLRGKKVKFEKVTENSVIWR